MDNGTAQQQKTLIAEKQISYVRAAVILYGTLTFFLLDEIYLKKELAYCLLLLIWIYGSYVLYFKPYEKYPIFLASWFTYIGDCVFATLWLYATGGFYSPYHVLFYTSIVAVAFRFDLKTTMFTAALYTAAYFGLILFLGQQQGHWADALVRTGFIFIIGFLTNLITKETLNQTQQKIEMMELAKASQEAQRMLAESQNKLALLNESLEMQNSMFNHAEKNALIGSFAMELSSKKLVFSDNFYRLLGYEPGGFVPSIEKYLSFVHPDDKEKYKEQLEEIMKNHHENPIVHRIISKTGQIKHLRSTRRTINEGLHQKIIGTVQDISEDVILHDQLHHKNQELQQINVELESFNYFASHDLQEPVRKIQTFSSILLQKAPELSDQVKNYIERISHSASRMQALIQAFLNYSRVTNTDIAFVKTDLNQLLEEVKINIHDKIEEKNALIEYEKMPVIPVIPIQFQQLIINLLSNAIKYCEEGVQPIIKISAEKIPGKNMLEPQADTKTNYWKISIKDNGIGFETIYAEKIFDVFTRLHSKDKYSGSGIGLAICKKVAAMHNGFISVESAPGMGSTFSIFIPEEN